MFCLTPHCWRTGVDDDSKHPQHFRNGFDVAETTLATLKRIGVDYEVIACDPDYADTRGFCEQYGYPLPHFTNVIVAAGNTETRCYAAYVLLATTRLDVNHSVRKRLGTSRTSFAFADEARPLAGMEISDITPFGLPESLPLWFDQHVMVS